MNTFGLAFIHANMYNWIMFYLPYFRIFIFLPLRPISITNIRTPLQIIIRKHVPFVHSWNTHSKAAISSFSLETLPFYFLTFILAFLDIIPHNFVWICVILVYTRNQGVSVLNFSCSFSCFYTTNFKEAFILKLNII